MKKIDGKIKGEYFTKSSRGKLIQSGVYAAVKDDNLISIIVPFKMNGNNNFEKFI